MACHHRKPLSLQVFSLLITNTARYLTVTSCLYSKQMVNDLCALSRILNQTASFVEGNRLCEKGGFYLKIVKQTVWNSVLRNISCRLSSLRTFCNVHFSSPARCLFSSSWIYFRRSLNSKRAGITRSIIVGFFFTYSATSTFISFSGHPSLTAGGKED